MDSNTPNKNSLVKEPVSCNSSKTLGVTHKKVKSGIKFPAPRNLTKKAKEISSTAKFLRCNLTRKKAISRTENKTPQTATSMHKSSLSYNPQPYKRKTTAELAKEQEENLLKECTFHPKVSAYPVHSDLPLADRIELLATPSTGKIAEREKTKWNQISVHLPKQTSQSDTLASERLFQDAKVKHKNREKHLRQVSEVIYHCSFKPTTSPNPKVTAPLYKRAEEVQKARAKHKLELEVDASKHPDLTFSPHISNQSKRLAGARRVKSDSHKSEEKPKSFVKTDQKIQFNATAKRKTLIPTQSYSFCPQINQNSRFLMETAKHRKSETMQDKIQRWNMVREKTPEEEPQYPFSPKIDIISKQLGRSASPHRHQFAQEMFTFAPQTCQNSKYRGVKSSYCLLYTSPSPRDS